MILGVGFAPGLAVEVEWPQGRSRYRQCAVCRHHRRTASSEVGAEQLIEQALPGPVEGGARLIEQP